MVSKEEYTAAQASLGVARETVAKHELQNREALRAAVTAVLDRFAEQAGVVELVSAIEQVSGITEPTDCLSDGRAVFIKRVSDKPTHGRRLR